MMRKRIIVIACTIILIALVGWYWFRPELLFLNARVHEEFPAGDEAPGIVLARGRFHGVAHDSRGTATVHQLGNGKRVLRFTDFQTSNGPALSVYLIAALDATDSAAVDRAEVIDLGQLKGNIGEQNYEVPAEVDLTRYRAVSVWCRRFHVNFATAPLASP